MPDVRIFNGGGAAKPKTLHHELLAVNPLNPDEVLAPFDSQAWTAVDLRTALTDIRHDLIFLAGHFNAGSTLAADWTTELTAAEVAASAANTAWGGNLHA